uniref:type II toxin-antitoxin system death-on-curing family toxin n=1 Tax=Hafnia alvei TaxID=569 RepID=UPI0026E91CAC|nr:type II toxin-antitoxin system death-on-curing family toxin [Hafnia alvei]
MEQVELVFLSKDEVKRIHAETLPQSGTADDGRLDGAVNRVMNLHHYHEINDIYTLAAMYLIGVAKAHAFHDGNKRTAFQAASIFLMMNGSELSSSLSLVKLTVFAAMGAASLEETTFALKILSDYDNDLLNDYEEEYL